MAGHRRFGAPIFLNYGNGYSESRRQVFRPARGPLKQIHAFVCLYWLSALKSALPPDLATTSIPPMTMVLSTAFSMS